MFRSALERAVTDPGLAACAVASPIPAARGGRVISPDGPQPPQLGDDSQVYDDGALRITQIAGPALGLASGYALAGEIDESTLRGLAGKLAEIAVHLDEVHLDLGALDYCDLAGLRAIVQLADAGRRRVVLHRVPPHLRAVLDIVGWDVAPGVELAS